MAIIIERTITVKNDQATLDSPLYLYRGDGDIVFLFEIKEKNKVATFSTINSQNVISTDKYVSHGEVRIYKPDGSKCVFTTRAEIIEDKLQAIFSREHIDHIQEIGIHKLQIHLYDNEETENRFTIPPVDLHVLMPVGDDNAQIDEAIVGYSLLNAVDEDVPTFDEEGNYNKTEWDIGDIITKNKLNKIEDALYEITTADDNFITNEVLEAEIGGIEAELKGKADRGHHHDGKYAPSNHTHTGYAASGHTHYEYATSDALTSHNHDGKYADYAHTHEYAPKTHVHENYVTEEYINSRKFLTAVPEGYVQEGDLNNILASKRYATQEYVDVQIKNAGGFGGGSGGEDGYDHSQLATKLEVNAKADANHNHDGKYATPKDIEDAINNIEFKDVNLSNYYNKEEIDTALSNKADSTYVSEYYALKSEIPNIDDVKIPQEISYFDNDAGYVTNTEINEAVAPINEAIDNINEELESYAKKADIPTIPTNVSVFENDKGYITNEAIVPVNEAISNINQDLEDNYAKITDIPTNVSALNNDAKYITTEAIPANVSEFTNDANYSTWDEVSEYLSNYTTKDEINQSGYITSGKDDTGKYFITRIEVVDTLPNYEEPGVLYIVRA